MALKAVLSKTEHDALPEAVRGVYKENNGNFTLEVEGMVADSEHTKLKTSLKEFRDNNITLIQERDGLKDKVKSFDGVDVNEYKSLKEGKEKLEKAGIKKTDDLATLIADQVQKATAPLQEKLNGITEEREKLSKEVAARSVDDHIRNVALKTGAREDALDDVLHRGRQVFRFVDGKVMAMDGDKPRFSEADPSKPLTADEWVGGLAKSANFLFKPSGGGGASGGAGGAGAAKVLINPDAMTFGQNIEAIAKGTTEVRLNK